MFLSFENAIAALEDQVRTDGVLLMVEPLVECFLLGQQNYSAVVFGATRRHITALIDRSLDVAPDVRRVIPVQVNDLFGEGGGELVVAGVA